MVIEHIKALPTRLATGCQTGFPHTGGPQINTFWMVRNVGVTSLQPTCVSDYAKVKVFQGLVVYAWRAEYAKLFLVPFPTSSLDQALEELQVDHCSTCLKRSRASRVSR